MSVRAASGDLLAVRGAVRDALVDLPRGSAVVVGCSGGPDSLALTAAVGHVAPRLGLTPHAVVVDHGLQPGSAEVAGWAADVCRRLGVPGRVLVVTVGTDGGPEAAARTARRAALQQVAAELGAPVILLGHTREDQAETVLLRLTRGAGARSLAAMAPRTWPWTRPLLDLPRAVVRAAAAEALAPLGERPWADPHNDDPAYARVRVRGLLDRFATELGPGVVAGLARSAALLRDDADALDALAEEAFGTLFRDDDGGLDADCADLAATVPAIRSRVVRLACLRLGCPDDRLTFDQVRVVEALATAWHGQGAVSLPGGVTAARACGRLCLRPRQARPGAPSGA